MCKLILHLERLQVVLGESSLWWRAEEDAPSKTPANSLWEHLPKGTGGDEDPGKSHGIISRSSRPTVPLAGDRLLMLLVVCLLWPCALQGFFYFHWEVIGPKMYGLQFTIHTTLPLNIFQFDLRAQLSFQIRLAKQPKLNYITALTWRNR